MGHTDLLERTGAPDAGEVIAGRYEVVRVLASGGMGVVVEARHVQLRQRVAMKFLLPGVAERSEFVERFLREARASVALQGEHAVRVTDVGTLDDGAPYMVMEYLEGHDLREELRRGPFSVTRAVDYVVQACEAIAEAHARGIVHRDLKPSNLFLARRPDGSPLVKVLDFGISKVLADESSREADHQLTATTAVLGSPQYMSPEQIRSARAVDRRTDIWSLGVVLYELLADAVPFAADTVPAMSVMIVADPPTPLATYRADLPPGLEAVVLRCLEKRADARYATVGDLVEALAPFASSTAHQTIQRAVRISRDSMPDFRLEAEPILGRVSATEETAIAPSTASTSAVVAAPAVTNEETRVELAPGGTLAATSGSTRSRARRSALRLRYVTIGAIAVAAGAIAIAVLGLRPSGDVGSATTERAGPPSDNEHRAAPASAPIDVLPVLGGAGEPTPPPPPRAAADAGAASQPGRAPRTGVRAAGPAPPRAAVPAPQAPAPPNSVPRAKPIDPLGDRK